MEGQVTTLGPWTVDDSYDVKYECSCGEKAEFELEELACLGNLLGRMTCTCGIEHPPLARAFEKQGAGKNFGRKIESPTKETWLPLFSFEVVAHEVETGTPLATVKPAGFLTLKGYVPLPSSCPSCGSNRVQETASSYDSPGSAFYEADWRCVDCWHSWTIGPKAQEQAPLTLIALEGRKDARGQRTVSSR